MEKALELLAESLKKIWVRHGKTAVGRWRDGLNEKGRGNPALDHDLFGGKIAGIVKRARGCRLVREGKPGAYQIVLAGNESFKQWGVDREGDAARGRQGCLGRREQNAVRFKNDLGYIILEDRFADQFPGQADLLFFRDEAGG